MAAFDYESAKAQYGAQTAKQMQQQQGTAPAPAPIPAGPTNFPPPPTAAPAPAPALMPNGQTAAGGGTAEQRQTATMAAGSFRDDSADAGKTGTGDPYLDELRSGKVAGSEDWRRFSNAELKAMQKYYVGNGKFRNIYGDIVDKPDDVGPNTPPGFNGTGDRIGGGGGGGGGGQGGGGAAGSGPSGGGAGSDLSSMMEGVLKSGLSGENSRYSPEAMQGLLAQIKQNVESQRKTQLRQAGQSAVERGMTRSGNALATDRSINASSGASFTNQYAGVLKAKIDADHQDKMDALDRSQKYLDAQRDELYRRDMSAIQRQQFQANLDLAYANIKSQREALSSNQQYGKDMLAAQYGYGATFGG